MQKGFVSADQLDQVLFLMHQFGLSILQQVTSKTKGFVQEKPYAALVTSGSIERQTEYKQKGSHF